MTTKIYALLALLTLLVSVTTATVIPQCSLAPPTAIIPQFLPPVTAFRFEHQAMQAYRQQRALASIVLQQPIAQLQLQSLAHQIIQTIARQQQQQQQFLPALSQLVVVNSATNFQHHMLQPNPQAVVNAAAYLQQQQLQQILPVLSQLALANPATYPAAYLQLQQLFPSNPLEVANVAAYLQQQQLLQVNPLAVSNPLVAAFLQQQQFQPFNQLSLMNPALSWQQPIVGGAIF